ncbi:Hypothetical predicted protein [Octopus vulgaris]|uniref:Uncharacterized protein n=1 Tax=Octopus vulgaris TaxID=6645 RepID=A0AA36F4F9_OCTVU|nr:Hypothetical predicted protein [Octopus vulgaris]
MKNDSCDDCIGNRSDADDDDDSRGGSGTDNSDVLLANKRNAGRTARLTVTTMHLNRSIIADTIKHNAEENNINSRFNVECIRI